MQKSAFALCAHAPPRCSPGRVHDPGCLRMRYSTACAKSAAVALACVSIQCVLITGYSGVASFRQATKPLPKFPSSGANIYFLVKLFQLMATVLTLLE